jgi:hypothetical protein
MPDNVRLTMDVATHSRRRATAHIWVCKRNMMDLVECTPMLHTVTKFCEAQFRIRSEERPAQALYAIKTNWSQEPRLPFVTCAGLLLTNKKISHLQMTKALNPLMPSKDTDTICRLTRFHGSSTRRVSLVTPEASPNGKASPMAGFLALEVHQSNDYSMPHPRGLISLFHLRHT